MSAETDAIAANLAKPKRARKGQEEIEHHSVADQIAAHNFLAEREATASITSLPIGITRTVPPGSV